MGTVLDLILHLDVYLAQLSSSLGLWLYAVLFLIVFCETGLVVTPFLPGDSLLFAVGALAAVEGSGLDVVTVGVVLLIAAILGDNLNYQIGRYIGPKIFSQPRSLFLNPEYLRRTHSFYEKHGGKTVFLARFLPILRTFAPFIAGVGEMRFRNFFLFSATGSVVWISCFLYAGYSFGNIEWVKRNFASVVMAVILVSLLPAVYAALQQWKASRGAKVPKL